MKKVAVVFNGGTISMKVDERLQAAVPSLSGEDIMSLVTGVEDYAKVENHTFSSLPSPHVTPKLMLELSKFVQDLANREDIDGIVVTHGTDTLEETAYFLDLTTNTKKPIVVTGAMRSSSELGYDGPFNLATSICTAISDEAYGRGVLVCFNGELNDSIEVTKANSMALNAFRTPNFGPVGVVDNNNVIFYRKGKKGVKLNPKNMDKEVALIKCVSGMGSEFIDFSLDKGYKGLVIEAMGRGNIPPEMLKGVEYARSKDIPVVIASRCHSGRVFDSYGYLGSGRDLRNLGCIFAGDLPGQKARIKLIVALGKTNNLNELKDMFEEGIYY